MTGEALMEPGERAAAAGGAGRGTGARDGNRPAVRVVPLWERGGGGARR